MASDDESSTRNSTCMRDGVHIIEEPHLPSFAEHAASGDKLVQASRIACYSHSSEPVLRSIEDSYLLCTQSIQKLGGVRRH